MSPSFTTAKLLSLRFGHSRPRFWTEGHPVTTKKLPESKPPKSRAAISADADDWIRLFIKHLELHLLEANRDLPPEAGISEFQMAAARAIFKTYLDSGMEFESVLELIGQVAVEELSVDLVWS